MLSSRKRVYDMVDKPRCSIAKLFNELEQYNDTNHCVRLDYYLFTFVLHDQLVPMDSSTQKFV